MAVQELAEDVHKILHLPNCKDHLSCANKTERAYSRRFAQHTCFLYPRKILQAKSTLAAIKVGLIPKKRGQGTCSNRSSTLGS